MCLYSQMLRRLSVRDGYSGRMVSFCVWVGRTGKEERDAISIALQRLVLWPIPMLLIIDVPFQDFILILEAFYFSSVVPEIKPRASSCHT